MMKRAAIRQVLAVLAVLPLWLALARADAPAGGAKADVQAAIQGTYDKADADFYLRDLDGVFAAYAPDFVSVQGTTKAGIEGPRHLAQYLLSACKSVQWTSAVLETASNDTAGDTATVTVRRSFKGVSDNAETQQDDAIAIVRVDRDFWAKTDKGWLLKREKNISSQTTVNGQPITGMLDDLPSTPTKYNLGGVWSVQSPTSGHYVVRINQFSNRLVATKLTGTLAVPAGFVSFYATYTGDTFFGKKQFAQPGHYDAEWVVSQIKVLGVDNFTVADPVHGVTTYQRMKP